MRRFITTKQLLRAAILSLVLAIPFFCNAQSVVIPENVKRKCADAPIQEKVRLAVARFSKTTDVYSGGNIDNFATMLSNAMFEIDCFRMLATINDANYKYSGKEKDDVRPHFIITGEITIYNHTTQEVKVIKPVSRFNAQIGFVLQIKDPVTKEIIFSKSFSQSASAIDTQNNHTNSIDKAYHGALEKGILDAVTYIVDNRDRIYSHVNLLSKEGGSITTTSVSPSKYEILAQKITFQKLTEIEKVLSNHKSVKKVEKKLIRENGEINVTMIGSIDDLTTILMDSFPDRLTINGFEAKKLTLTLN